MDEETLFASLEAEMKEMPCEDPTHGHSYMHEGPGVWYIFMGCPHCGWKTAPVLCCDRYKQFLPIGLIISGATVLQCSNCENQFLQSQVVVTSKRREV
jgi:hypothetical protein